MSARWHCPPEASHDRRVGGVSRAERAGAQSGLGVMACSSRVPSRRIRSTSCVTPGPVTVHAHRVPALLVGEEHDHLRGHPGE